MLSTERSGSLLRDRHSRRQGARLHRGSADSRGRGFCPARRGADRLGIPPENRAYRGTATRNGQDHLDCSDRPRPSDLRDRPGRNHPAAAGRPTPRDGHGWNAISHPGGPRAGKPRITLETAMSDARDPSIDVLRGLAILTMVEANMAPYSLDAPHPLLIRAIGTFAAPTFVFLAGLMVSTSRRPAKMGHALRRSALLFCIAATIDVACWHIAPFD